MPKKTRPNYGIDPVQAVPLFSFNEDEVVRLLNALATVEVDRNSIIERLAQIARTYLWQRDQNRAKPSRAEQNAALTEVSQLAQALEMKLSSLDMETEWELATSLPVFQARNLVGAIGDLAYGLGNLGWAAERALEAGKRISGTRVLTHVQRAVTELANLYTEFTGRPFSHNPKVLTQYDGNPHSQAGRFIVEFFAIVDSSISPKSLSTAMAKVVKSTTPSSEAVAS
jgi:hypothetical protein